MFFLHSLGSEPHRSDICVDDMKINFWWNFSLKANSCVWRIKRETKQQRKLQITPKWLLWITFLRSSRILSCGFIGENEEVKEFQFQSPLKSLAWSSERDKEIPLVTSSYSIVFFLHLPSNSALLLLLCWINLGHIWSYFNAASDRSEQSQERERKRNENL